MGVTIRFAPYERISSLIRCGAAMHVAARQNSVAAPTVDAITAMTALPRRRNIAPHSMTRNIRVLVIVVVLTGLSVLPAMQHLRRMNAQYGTNG